MNVKHGVKIKPLIVSVALPLLVGGLAAFLTRDGMHMFALLRKPPLTPPGWVFPVAWTLLYIMMGLASYYVWISPVSAARKERALTVYAMQLGANLLWTLIFFLLEMYLAAFLWLVLLWLLIAACTLLFHYISGKAGKLMLPYLVWTAFAGYMNMGIWLLNR